ncbi:MAG TPA: leucine-rich repeat domain-containing protein [Sunxiuqinia sp.]|nr:leucine-rich repeat domain-containing protein [Sunxiuqinia sp.]
MKTTTLISVFFLLFNLAAEAQKTSPVEKFEGRGNYNAQLVLDYSYQNLDKIPISADNPQVQTLILDNNKLTKLPNWIHDLSKLKILSVRNNDLHEITSLLGRCTNLEQLYLSGNPNLKDLPDLSACKKLQLIDVVGTGIHDIPAGVHMMDNLYYFKYNK